LPAVIGFPLWSYNPKSFIQLRPHYYPQLTRFTLLVKVDIDHLEDFEVRVGRERASLGIMYGACG